MVALAVVVLLLAALALLQARRVGRLRRRLDAITRGEEGRSLEAVLDAHMDRVLQVGRDLERLAEGEARLEASVRRAVQRTGLVRFNPFEDTGGNQSFAIALLDAGGDGLVLSSLHARAGTRVYAKSIVAGRSEAALSDEEAEAVRRALGDPVRDRPGP